MKRFFLLLGLMALCPAVFAARPNVILIMADDFGYECVTANGGESYQTPNLDKLAASGVRFENCHVQPLCTPTRVQLMTGRYNVRNYINFGTLPRTETTFGNLMKKAGYATGICGKWQLGHELDAPQHFGFDEALLWQHTRRPPRYANPGLELNGVPQDHTNGEYGPKLINDFALEFVTKHKDAPFFLYYPMMLTHDPFQATPDSPDWDPTLRGEDKKKDKRHFAEMTAYMDKLIGQLVAKLEELAIRDNTLLIFVGDNGTLSAITTRFKGADYKGGKGSTTTNGTHVPLIVSWPAAMKQGSVCADLVSSTDFLPTVCAAAGVEVPANVDGTSFLPQLQGQPGTPRDWLYTWYSPRQNAGMEVTEYAFDQRFKLYRTGKFYDLKGDPKEQQDLAAASLSAEAAAAKGKLQAALDRFKDARPAGLDEQYRAAKREMKEAQPGKKKKKNKGKPKAEAA